VRFTETPSSGAYLTDLDLIRDSRGFFSRSTCNDESAEVGLHTGWPQQNAACRAAGRTVRGMNSNRHPFAEKKTVQCSIGTVCDAIIDLRAGSDTQPEWFGTESTASSRTVLFVPSGLAHGFMTPVPKTEISYRMGRRYEPNDGSGIRRGDPLVRFERPVRPAVVNVRDGGSTDLADPLEKFS
jgi:dTDP-4-dehydrorhamnose 3,5-epimerase